MVEPVNHEEPYWIEVSFLRHLTKYYSNLEQEPAFVEKRQ